MGTYRCKATNTIEPEAERVVTVDVLCKFSVLKDIHMLLTEKHKRACTVIISETVHHSSYQFFQLITHK